MTHLKTPPKGRNAQIRTYWRLLQFALKHKIVTESAKAIFQELDRAKTRIDASPTDSLKGIVVTELVTAAQAAMGFAGGDTDD